jgi:hypothetical protein
VYLAIAKILEALVGRWRPSVAVLIARLILGIAIPALIVAYGVRSVFSGHVYILDRTGRPTDVSGLPAVAVGIAYAAAGLIVYVHVCWEEHAYLAGAREFARTILLGVIGAALAATFGLALI